MSKDTNTNASKDGKAASPQDTAGKFTHSVADGHQVSVASRIRGAGHKVKASDFSNTADPDGTSGLQRLVDSGVLVKAGAKAKEAEGERAGGGAIENGGATGAGPSAAQIAAAEAGDKGSRAVVDAALGGTQAEFTAAATPGKA